MFIITYCKNKVILVVASILLLTAFAFAETITNKVRVDLSDTLLPAGTNFIGQVSASNETSTIYNGAVALTKKFAPIQACNSGDNIIVSAVSNKKIRAISGLVMSAGTVNLIIKSDTGASATNLTGIISLAANTGFIIPKDETGNFETVSGKALNFNLSAAGSLAGYLGYLEVP